MENLKEKLDDLVTKHKKEDKGLDPVWIGVTIPKKFWRLAKQLGAKKDYYYGWVFYSTSTNSGGYELYEKMNKLISESDLPLQITYRDL